MKYKRTVNVLFSIILSVALASGLFIHCKSGKTKSAYVREIETWHRNRIKRLTTPTGWLSLAGLYWLKPGENRFGSDPSNQVVFPAKAPAFMGTFFLADSLVRMEIRADVAVVLDEKPVTSTLLKSDNSGAPSILKWNTLSWYVIERGEKIGVRLKDRENPPLVEFKGIETFPIDSAWQVKARFEAYDPPKTVPIASAIGTVENESVPGALVFELAGQTLRLEPFGEPGDEHFFIVFGDQTNGKETYGAGRFLYVKAPDNDGITILDFNKAYNPPCAFTEFATCPLPPLQNRLPIEVLAGEKKYGEQGH